MVFDFSVYLIQVCLHYSVQYQVPKTVRTALSASSIHNSIPKKMYAVCPREKCNALYTIDGHERCSNVIYGKVCGAELGYNFTYLMERFVGPQLKEFQFIHPSAWLKHMFQSHEFVCLINLWRSLCDHKYIMTIGYGKTWKHRAFSKITTT